MGRREAHSFIKIFGPGTGPLHLALLAQFPETSWRKVSTRWSCHQALVEVAVKQYIPPPATFGGASSTPSKAKFMVQITKLPLRPDFSIQNHYIQNIGEITMSYRLGSVGSIYV
ncbi:hypothetical protein DY000_02007812 [Brassica cretica]|uniref:Uncharacterized protein n=1 Tax=Brassica cretica TaxID=69181 RepID=A0ABQ7C650_BRACR|nr:hypothetical protein DY000_02007812 [Brassica cretica]